VGPLGSLAAVSGWEQVMPLTIVPQRPLATRDA
jgi:hypothetical protein